MNERRKDLCNSVRNLKGMLCVIIAIIVSVTTTQDLAYARMNMEKKTSLEQKLLAAVSPNSLVVYAGHQQTYGYVDSVSDGQELGKIGQRKRLEAICVVKGYRLAKVQGEIQYQVHVQSKGNLPWVNSGTWTGTTGQGKRIEAIRFRLTGQLAKKYDIYYSTHCQKIGWTRWTKGIAEHSEAGGWCGTAGLCLRVEAIKIMLLPKKHAPKNQANNESFTTGNSFGLLTYSGHQQSFGDLQKTKNGDVLGNIGQSKRLEGVAFDITGAKYSGGINYRVHIQGIGWQTWKANGAYAGTKGQSKRVEAIELVLTGDLEKYCDIWYRVHVQNYGWLGWAKNGQTAGSTGISYRVEAVQAVLVPKTIAGPGSNKNYYKDKPKYSRKQSKAIALTFDDGPGERTGELLDVLKKYDAHATFFVVGSNASMHTKDLKRMEKIGCEVGSHTYTHPFLSNCDRYKIKDEIQITDSIIRNAIGHDARLLRPPYGGYNQLVSAVSGKPLIMWSVDTNDWKTLSAKATVDCVLSEAGDGDIVLMHDIHSSSVDAAKQLIPMLIAQGYELVTVSELAEIKGVQLVNGLPYRCIK